jgi:hypothetical protein
MPYLSLHRHIPIRSIEDHDADGQLLMTVEISILNVTVNTIADREDGDTEEPSHVPSTAFDGADVTCIRDPASSPLFWK